VNLPAIIIITTTTTTNSHPLQSTGYCISRWSDVDRSMFVLLELSYIADSKELSRTMKICNRLLQQASFKIG
jgi:hypothetical protein